MGNDEALSWFMDGCGLPAKSRKMFGGLGVFSDDVMFALIHGGEVYVKSTGEMAGLYVKDGHQFEPPFRKGMKMPYWNVPESIEKNKLGEWAAQALEHTKATKKVTCVLGI